MFLAKQFTLISDNTTEYISGQYSVQNNPWGRGALVNGVDFTVATEFLPEALPNNVTFSWNWRGNGGGGGTILGYHDHTYKPADSNGRIATQIKNFSDLSVDYDVSYRGSNLQYFDVAWDLFLKSAPLGDGSTITQEVMVFLHTPVDWQFQNQSFTVTCTGLTAAVVNVTPGAIPLIAVKMTSDLYSGTISFSEVFNILIAQGILTGNEYLDNIQFGAEEGGGSGSLHIKKLNYRWK